MKLNKALAEQKNSRYNRQELLTIIGTKGQRRIGKKKVAVVGVGALGTVAGELLVRAGIGKVILIDRDLVEESNLQRQLLFDEKDIGKSKAVAARQKLKEINSQIEVESFNVHLSSENISLIKDAEVVLDCTDNLQTRFLLNDFCKKNKIPLIYAAAIKTSGYVFAVHNDGPCLRCFLKEASLDTCDAAGVLNTITTVIAAQQVTLALKIILKEPEEILPELLHLNIWSGEVRKIKVKKKLDCLTCRGSFTYLEKKELPRVVKFCSANRFQVQGNKVNFRELKKRWSKSGEVKEEGESLSFRGILLFKDGRALIEASDEKEALAEYSKWVGN